MGLMKRPPAVLLVVMLACLTAAPAMAAPILVFPSPGGGAVALGDSTWVDIEITSVTDLVSFDVVVAFNPAVVTASQTKLGNVLTSPTFFFTDILDNNLGRVSGVAAALGAGPGVTGSGTLFSIEFSGIAYGVSPLDLTLVHLLNSQLDPIDATVTGGSLNVVPEPATLTLVGLGLFGALARVRRHPRTR